MTSLKLPISAHKAQMNTAPTLIRQPAELIELRRLAGLGSQQVTSTRAMGNFLQAAIQDMEALCYYAAAANDYPELLRLAEIGEIAERGATAVSLVIDELRAALAAAQAELKEADSHDKRVREIAERIRIVPLDHTSSVVERAVQKLVQVSDADAAECEFTKDKMARQVMDLDSKCDAAAAALKAMGCKLVDERWMEPCQYRGLQAEGITHAEYCDKCDGSGWLPIVVK